MIRYPNSKCEKHSNVVVSEPVCLLCLMDVIELLTKTNERLKLELAWVLNVTQDEQMSDTEARRAIAKELKGGAE